MGALWVGFSCALRMSRVGRFESSSRRRELVLFIFLSSHRSHGLETTLGREERSWEQRALTDHLVDADGDGHEDSEGDEACHAGPHQALPLDGGDELRKLLDVEFSCGAAHSGGYKRSRECELGLRAHRLGWSRNP